MTRRGMQVSRDLGRTITSDRRQFLQVAGALAGGLAVGSTVSQKVSAAPPPSFDLRKATNGANYITSVKDQGLCHTCTAFGVIAAIEGSYHWQKKKAITAANPELDLSENDLFYSNAPPMPRPCDVDHWWPRYAVEYCKAHGVKREPDNGTLFNIATATQLVTSNKPQDNIDAIKAWISSDNGGPVATVMVEFADFGLFGENRTGTGDVTDVYEPKGPPRIVGGHVLCIVGYGPNYWICKNSWSSQTIGGPWNQNGYVRIKMNGRTSIDQIDAWGVQIPNTTP
jgi:C1A family cysteine protease